MTTKAYSSQKEVLAKYSKEDLILIYDTQKSVRKVADVIGCNWQTVKALFKNLNIPTKGFKAHTPTSKAKLSIKAAANAKVNNPISHILNSPGWNANAVAVRQANNSYQQPHPESRAMLTIPDNLFKEVVEYRGVLDAAREWKCSQSAVRDRAHKLGMVLPSGHREALTSTPEYAEMARARGLAGALACPNKNTSIEIATQEYLTKKGVKFQLHPKLINLTIPDLYVDPMVAIYVDGCRWHGCPTCNASVNFKGLAYNLTHDKYVNVGLVKAGYKVVRIWEHSVKAGDFSALDFLTEIDTTGIS